MIRLMLNRRSIRKYKGQSVEKDKVDRLLTAGLLAPSSRNRKPWEFIVVDEPGELFDLSQAKAQGSSFVKDAPVAVIIIADTDKSDVCIEDTSIAASYMQLEGERLDLGSCWVQIRGRKTQGGKDSEGYVRQIFGIPNQYLIEAILTFGYKGEDKEPHNLDEVETAKVHFHRYGIEYPGKFG